MELQAFVTRVLIEITNGIAFAQNEVKEKGAIVNPMGMSQIVSGYFTWSEEDRGGGRKRLGQLVDFEVLVFAEEKDGAEGKIGVSVGPIVLGASAQGRIESASSIANKIKFSIPVLFPEG